MKNNNKISWALLFAVFITGCASSPPKPSLEIREYQTRVYDAKISDEIFHAVVNSLQDDGFVIDTADIESGFIKANISGTDISSREVLQKATLAYFTFGISLLFTDGNINNVNDMSATITISKLRDSTKLRTSFVFKQLNTEGEVIEHRQIVDKEVYQKFFTSIEKSIFYDENINTELVKSPN